jgi:E3 ubiquitin-protein ligase HECTD1
MFHFQIEFLSEEGTGLGPTLEFFALVAAEFQKKILSIWLSDDEVHDDLEREVDIGHGVKPPGYYVQRSCGLFPAPLPQDGSDIEHAERLFHTLGAFLAKSIQDCRLVDIPMSRPFLKMMCRGEVGSHITQQFIELTTREDDVKDGEPMETDKDFHSIQRSHSIIPPWYSGVLCFEDFEQINPHRAKFLRQLKELANRKSAILSDQSLSEREKWNLVQNLSLETAGGGQCHLEDLG